MATVTPTDLIQHPDMDGGDAHTQQQSERPRNSLSRFRRPAMRVAAYLILAVLASVGGKAMWRYFQTFETTDDAQVDGHITSLSPRIDGTVIAVHTDDNQEARTGQLLVELDPRDYEVAVQHAMANVSAARGALAARQPGVQITTVSTATAIATTEQQLADCLAALSGAERDLAAAVANVQEAEANKFRADADLERYKALVDKDEVSRQQYDYALAAARAAEARVRSAVAAAQAAEHQMDQRRAMVKQAQARLTEASANAPKEVSSTQSEVAQLQANVRAAEAQLNQALLNLSYCRILSPVAGIVGRRTVEVGNRIQPQAELLYITQLDDIWVTANFKETQFRKMKAGQRAMVTVDALGGRAFDGEVESTPGATGAKFSLLPPENATGNYVKVVQRLPVRIRLKQGSDSFGRLRPGMSVNAKVWVQ